MPENVYKCPFSHRECRSCPVYRGKHSYIISSDGDETPRSRITKKVEFDWQGSLKETLRKHEDVGLDPDETLVLGTQGIVTDSRGKEVKIILKVFDKETGERRFCTISEAKDWDWENRQKVRSIGPWHIYSFERLLSVLGHKAQTGCKEVELIEAPFYMGC